MSKKYLEETAAAPLTPRQMAKLFGGLIGSTTQHLDIEVVRSSWAFMHEAFFGGSPKHNLPVDGSVEMTKQQRLWVEAFVSYGGALVTSCLGFCRKEDVKAASAFYAEQDGPWELLKKEKN